ncbi:hypothetical protein [Mesomycoplasma molare]|uniref:Lipoprotein n=1 Tax=Mesomycoplasma molare TaxID=171288 RepID=A0ABY5TUX3_9BACT|nr:hypothetical protein [Mesomycoplasma molare]UWD34452.1 hypothetical protein NX772_01315 [Mesomycoplasma molare]
MKKIKKTLFIVASSLTMFSIVSCGTSLPSQTGENSQLRKTNQFINFQEYGIPKKENIKIRTLLFPAARSENKLDSEGFFNFRLHHSPVNGVTGEWTAFATEVKSLKDNTLVEPIIVKKAITKAESNAEFPLKFTWNLEAEKLEEGKIYTFIFWKNDGTEKIVFQDKHIKESNDTFEAKK